MAVEQNNKPHTADDANLFSWIQINRKYFRTLPGIMKILEVIVGVICLYLSSPAIPVTSQWFAYIVIICIVVTAIWCFIYLLSAREAVSFPINWALTEMLNTFFLAMIIGITSVFQISHWAGAHNVHGRWMNIFAGIFGAANCVFYLISTCLAYIDWQQTHTINP